MYNIARNEQVRIVEQDLFFKYDEQLSFCDPGSRALVETLCICYSDLFKDNLDIAFDDSLRLPHVKYLTINCVRQKAVRGKSSLSSFAILTNLTQPFSNLKSLTLANVRLSSTSFVGGLYALEELVIRRAYFPKEDFSADTFFSCVPNVRRLTIAHSENVNFDVGSLSALEYISLGPPYNDFEILTQTSPRLRKIKLETTLRPLKREEFLCLFERLQHVTCLDKLDLHNTIFNNFSDFKELYSSVAPVRVRKLNAWCHYDLYFELIMSERSCTLHSPLLYIQELCILLDRPLLPNDLAGLDNLRTLAVEKRVDTKDTKSIADDAFRHTPKLKYLCLENTAQLLARNIFVPLKELETLKLISMHYLIGLEEGMLEGLESLTLLDAQVRRLQPLNVLEPATNLQKCVLTCIHDVAHQDEIKQFYAHRAIDFVFAK